MTALEQIIQKNELRRQKQRECQRRYAQSKKGKARAARFNRSAKGKARSDRFAKSAKGRLRDLIHNEKHAEYQLAYQAERRQALCLEMLNPVRTSVEDLQDWLGRQLRSDELDWWSIVIWTHAEGWIKPAP